MSADLPTRPELRRGLTVEVEQPDGDRIVGEIGTILTDDRTHPEGIRVKLQSGAEGRVKAIGPEH